MSLFKQWNKEISKSVFAIQSPLLVSMFYVAHTNLLFTKIINSKGSTLHTYKWYKTDFDKLDLNSI
jgi:hypothetical protein